MNDSLPVSTGHTKRYQLPVTHLEREYIDQCTDEVELEQIYQELIDEQDASHEILVQLTLDRLRHVYPNNSLLRPDPIQTERSTVVNSHSIPSAPVITNTPNGIGSIDHDQWNRFEEPVTREFDSDDEDLSTKNESYQSNKRLHLAEQHRLNADSALMQKNYRQSIDLYTKSIGLESNILAYRKRATAYFKSNNFDAAINDYSHVLSRDSQDITALKQRAQCYMAKERYDQARSDLDLLLSIDPDNFEVQELINTLIALQTSEMQPTNIPPTDGDHPEIDPFHPPSSHHDDEDGMEVGDEAAGADLRNNLSDDEEPTSRNYNASPTLDELPIRTTQSSFGNSIDQTIGIQRDGIHHRTSQFSSITNQPIHENDENELYDYSASTSQSNDRSNNYQTSSENSSTYDAIANSNFGSIIQNWLRDFVKLQTNRRYIERPWSRSSRPYSLDRIQSDISRFDRFNDYRNAIDVSKKMLRNGLLDYHYHSDDLFDTLSGCAKCYLKIRDYPHAIQYATEALQYNKNDADILMYRAKAFENEKFFLFTHADYTRVPRRNFSYSLARHACEKLTFELISSEGENWREKLPNDQNDHERYLNYLKSTTDFSQENAHQWYQTHADRLYLDGCFVLATWFYTMCIELQSDIKECYSKRAACYLKVFEPQKAIRDCNVILKDDEEDFLALYYNASACKMSLDSDGYELIMEECVRLQPNNQIILAEYYSYKRKQIPRKNRRIRRKSIDEILLSYDELEQIRLESIYQNASIDSDDIREQCSLILHSTSFDILTRKLLQTIINVNRMIIRSEEKYQQEHPSEILPFSYIKYMLDIWIELIAVPDIDSVLSMLDEQNRMSLDELIDYYSKKFDDMEELNRLKRL